MQFFVHLHARIHGQRSQLCQQEFGDRSVGACAKDTLTDFLFSMLNHLFLTHIFWVEALATLDIMVAHRHAVATASADHQPLQQSRSFSWRAVATILAMSLAIRMQLGQIGFVLLPAQVASMDLTNQKRPLLLGKGFDVERAISMFGGMGPSEAKGSRIARITQHFEHGTVLQRHPMDLASMSTCVDAAREEQPLVAKILHRGPGGPRPFEGGKQQTDGVLDLGIGIEDDGLVLRVGQTDRQRHFQCCTRSFVKNPALQACLEHMKLGLRHGSLQPEQQTVVKGGRIVEAIFIQNEGSGHGTNFQQVMPIKRTPR